MPVKPVTKHIYTCDHCNQVFFDTEKEQSATTLTVIKAKGWFSAGNYVACNASQCQEKSKERLENIDSLKTALTESDSPLKDLYTTF